MALTNISNGTGLWFPSPPIGSFHATGIASVADLLTLDSISYAEEAQLIGTIHIADGGTKTFGLSSKIDWLAGAGIVFSAADHVLRVGLKKSSVISSSTGPPMRATEGTAAFNVWKDLVGGTDTITSSAWHSTSMANNDGANVTVAHGDRVALCFSLTASSGTPVVKIRGAQLSGSFMSGFPTSVLITSGPTFTAQAVSPNVIITFNDGTLGWIEGTNARIIGDTVSASIGNGNAFGNIFTLPFRATLDAVGVSIALSGSSSDFALLVLATPLATPSIVATVSLDGNWVTSGRTTWATLSTPQILEANTAYCLAIQQTTVNGVQVYYYDVNLATHFRANSFDENCYGANSAALGTFAAVNSGKRRYLIFGRLSQIDIGGGAPYHGAMAGGFLQ